MLAIGCVRADGDIEFSDCGLSAPYSLRETGCCPLPCMARQWPLGGQTRPSDLRLHKGSSTPSNRTRAPIRPLNPHERTNRLHSQTTETGHKQTSRSVVQSLVVAMVDNSKFSL
jgi:hypothetical protein